MSKIIKINKLFEKQAELYPNKIAIIDTDKKITYKKNCKIICQKNV